MLIQEFFKDLLLQEMIKKNTSVLKSWKLSDVVISMENRNLREYISKNVSIDDKLNLNIKDRNYEMFYFQNDLESIYRDILRERI